MRIPWIITRDGTNKFRCIRKRCKHELPNVRHTRSYGKKCKNKRERGERGDELNSCRMWGGEKGGEGWAGRSKMIYQVEGSYLESDEEADSTEWESMDSSSTAKSGRRNASDASKLWSVSRWRWNYKKMSEWGGGEGCTSEVCCPTSREWPVTRFLYSSLSPAWALVLDQWIKFW